jgi:hypothetical protein
MSNVLSQEWMCACRRSASLPCSLISADKDPWNSFQPQMGRRVARQHSSHLPAPPSTVRPSSTAHCPVGTRSARDRRVTFRGHTKLDRCYPRYVTCKNPLQSEYQSPFGRYGGIRDGLRGGSTFGTPIVSFVNGAIPEVVNHGKTGLLPIRRYPCAFFCANPTSQR